MCYQVQLKFVEVSTFVSDTHHCYGVKAATFSWTLADLYLVNLDEDKVTKLLETAGAKSLGTENT